MAEFLRQAVFGCAESESDVRFGIHSHEVVLLLPGLSRAHFLHTGDFDHAVYESELSFDFSAPV